MIFAAGVCRCTHLPRADYKIAHMRKSAAFAVVTASIHDRPLAPRAFVVVEVADQLPLVSEGTRPVLKAAPRPLTSLASAVVLSSTLAAFLLAASRVVASAAAGVQHPVPGLVGAAATGLVFGACPLDEITPPLF